MVAHDLWTWRDDSWSASDLIGFEVEARDGSVGKVDDATFEVGRSYVVVDTGLWIFGRKVLLPAGTIERVDVEQGTMYVGRTKDEIENAPEFDETASGDEAFRRELGRYYATTREPEAYRNESVT
jgi:PRC-barrel domain